MLKKNIDTRFFVPDTKFDWERKDSFPSASKSSVNCSDSLPRVRILGDSISLGYTPFVVDALEGGASVSRPAVNCGPSEFYLEGTVLEKDWLCGEMWDLIHVNFGIWDLHYLFPDGEIFDASRIHTDILDPDPVRRTEKILESGCVMRTSDEQYERNLRTILAILKQHARHVVFASTTPMPLWAGDGRDKRVPVRNSIARRVCAEMSVDWNDLYSVIRDYSSLQLDGCHYQPRGYAMLASAVVEKIKGLLY